MTNKKALARGLACFWEQYLGTCQFTGLLSKCWASRKRIVWLALAVGGRVKNRKQMAYLDGVRETEQREQQKWGK